jgi:hypothetical protein
MDYRNDIKPEDIKRFESLAKQLDKLMHKICKYNPEANIYVEDSWNFNLMKGPCHSEDRDQNPLYENIAACPIVFRSSGGGW